MNRLVLISLATLVFWSLNTLAAGETCANPMSYNLTEVDGSSCHGSYYNWGRAQNGWAYCYQWACTGDVLNQGNPVSNYSCEAVAPSHYSWGRAQNGWGYCYQYTPNGETLNQGNPVSNYSCEAVSPSHYSWGRATDGSTRCYQYTSNGYALNQGNPVSNYYCQ